MPNDNSTAVGAEYGEYVSVPDDPNSIVVHDAEDGGAYVEMPGSEKESAPPDMTFYSNLAKVLKGPTKDRIVQELLDKIEQDKQSREERDKKYAEGIKRTGLGDEAPGGAEFEGASKTVHPMLIEACIDYESRIIKELFPPGGPVKAMLVGKATAEKTEKARRKTDHMNWQLTVQMPEARPVLETMLTQVPLGGSQFVRQYWDHRVKRPRWEFASVDRIFIPFNAADFASAHRKTFWDTISATEFQQRIASGLYIEIDAPAPSSVEQPTAAETASRKVEGATDPGINVDGDRDIYEVMVHLEVSDETFADLDAEKLAKEEPGDIAPYLISIDLSSRQMLSMYRAWEDGDPAHEEIQHLFEFPFIPWRGAMAIGFPHIIGSLAAAATGALRALLDSAHVNNAVGGLMLKGSGSGGQTVSPQIGQFTEIDSGLETDDIRKRVMPFNFSQPSPVLFQLLQFVVQSAKEVVRTSLDESPTDGGAPVPVGTQMSRVEEGLIVFSAIHGRAHTALNRLLAGLHRLNRLYLPPELKVDQTGKEILVYRTDYEGPIDVQPVSDPTVYSDQQRWAQLNYIQSRAAANPPLWKMREVELAGLKLIKWPDPESLLNDQPQPHELNAVNENMAMVLGQPVMAFPDQDHLAHLQVLFDFMKSPMLGSNPLVAPKFLPMAIQHAIEHIAYFYVEQNVAVIQKASGEHPAQLMSTDPALKKQFDGVLAAASELVVKGVEQQLQGAMPLLQAAMQQMQAMAPKPPMDPAAAAVAAAQAETQRKAAADGAGHQLDAAKTAGDLAVKQQANAIAADRNQVAREGQEKAAATKLATTQADNSTAIEISEERLASGAGSHFTNGQSMTHP